MATEIEQDSRDIEELEAPELRRIPFGRSRALAVLTAVVFDTVLRVTAPKMAAATHTGAPPCTGGACHCCQDLSICGTLYENTNEACPSGSNCWTVCDNCQTLYSCCDRRHYLDPQHSTYEVCVCRTAIGFNCSPC